VLIYVQEVVGELRKLRDYATMIRTKFDAGRDLSELLLDAESLAQRLNALIDSLPDPGTSGNSHRHLGWLVRELKIGSPTTCRQDIGDLVEHDNPGTIERIERWAKEMTYLDEELRDAVVPLIKARQFDSGIRKAFLVLTERLRSTYLLSKGTDSEGLVNIVFGQSSSHHTTMESAQRLAQRNLMSGLYGVIRNKFSQGDHEASIAELEAALSSVNLCLKNIEDFKAVP